MARDWSREEVEAVVASYFAMLTLELHGESYNKAAYRRDVLQILNQRTEGSVERKHQNISAILLELGYPYIFGYKPLGNYQNLLYEVVAEQTFMETTLSTAVQESVAAPAGIPTVEDILRCLESPPEVGLSTSPHVKEQSKGKVQVRPVINYLEREANNSSLGKAGEEFILNFERARLIQLGKNSLADQVEHVSISQGDGLGYDVRSFEIDGQERLIEVKTTAYGKQTPFFVTKNELKVSQEYEKYYHLYRLFRFRSQPKLFMLSGPLNISCRLEPVLFTAQTG